MTTSEINARPVVNEEFETVWKRTLPGNKPGRPVAKYWFRQGRNLGIAAHAAQERATIKELHARIQELERRDVTDLERKVRRLSAALVELHYCARQLRQAERSGNSVKKEAVRIDAAINNAGKLVSNYSEKVTT